MKRLVIVLLLLLSDVIYSQINITPISVLRNNDINGVPLDTGSTFTITGVVTVANELNSPSYIQDHDAGIGIFARGTGQLSTLVKLGDSIIVTGKLAQFNGLTQISPVQSWSKVDSGKAVEPKNLTIAEVLSQNWNGYEAYEGMLIRINNITISASGTWVGNTNYNISDGTGTMQIRITTGTNIVGQTIPTGTFDAIGALGQYKTSAPYNSGYQLLPRNISDIVTDNKPFILLPILTTNIDTTSFRVYFETLRQGNTEVKYGVTTNLELGTVTDTTLTKIHNIKISGLMPSTRYYFKVLSTNLSGTSESQLQVVNTASNVVSIGTINAYFNYSVDNSVAISGNQAKGSVDFSLKLLDRINGATSSIDMCVYSFYNANEIVSALKVARNRGVKVRIVYDSRTTQNSMQELINAGFLISKRPSSQSGIMHNKFFVFDARDSEPLNDWVWTGSWNLSSNESSYINNVIEINDYSLAQAYTKEFEEMWGSTTDTPDPVLAKFGSKKIDNTPKSFLIAGKEVLLYFSPSDGTNEKIKNAIRTADSSIYFNLFSFTRQDIANEMIARKNLGAKIRGIIDQTDATSVYTYLQPHGEIFAFQQSITLHHKYCIIDASNPYQKPYVITGSHNWSNNADQDNDENTLIINDIYLANQYMQEFKKRYNEKGGTGTFVVPVINSINDELVNKKTFEIYQNYPNPFNPVTSISFYTSQKQRLTINLYNTLGEKLYTIYDEITEPGKKVIDLNLSHLSSGIYYYSVLGMGNNIITKKMVLLK